jgi:hypothetical protein
MTFFHISPLARRRNQILRHLNLALGGCDDVGRSAAAFHIAMAIDTLAGPPVTTEQHDWPAPRSDEVVLAAGVLVETRSKFSKANSDLLKNVVDNPVLHDLVIEFLTVAVDCERAAFEFGAARTRAQIAHTNLL